MRRQCEYKEVYNPGTGMYERRHIYDNTLEDSVREKRVRGHLDELVKEHERRMAEKNRTIDSEPEDSDDEDELVDMCFKEGDLKILKQLELVKPSDIEDKDIDSLLNKTVYWINRLGNMKNGYSKNGKEEQCDNIDFIVSILKTYRDILQPEQDQSGGRYKQNRRNAYKIGAGGRYGDLVIHVPSLLFEHVLEAFKNGRQVLKKHVDGDTIDLLTKRFNSSKPYSELSKRVFSKLNQLSGLPNHRSSMKFQLL